MSKLGDDFYLQAGVTPRGHSYQESGDVVYELLLPGDTDAVLSLDTPCADLDLFAMTYRDGSQQCPLPQRPSRKVTFHSVGLN